MDDYDQHDCVPEGVDEYAVGERSSKVPSLPTELISLVPWGNSRRCSAIAPEHWQPEWQRSASVACLLLGRKEEPSRLHVPPLVVEGRCSEQLEGTSRLLLEDFHEEGVVGAGLVPFH